MKPPSVKELTADRRRALSECMENLGVPEPVQIKYVLDHLDLAQLTAIILIIRSAHRAGRDQERPPTRGAS